MKAFLDKDKCIYTCKEQSCKDCDICGKIVCHFNAKFLFAFLCFGFPLLILGGISAFLIWPWAVIIYIIFFISFFSIIEIRVLCSHCPHYGEKETKILKCWANYGSPKIWKYRPCKLNIYEKLVFFLGILILFAAPIIFYILTLSYILLGVYILFLIIGAFYMHNKMCKHCMNLYCPLNCVDKETKEKFLAHINKNKN